MQENVILITAVGQVAEGWRERTGAFVYNSVCRHLTTRSTAFIHSSQPVGKTEQNKEVTCLLTSNFSDVFPRPAQ
ncbi:hypothetical protein E2C01_058514 [Portunus trituberculatus]|uniref:Uncharacterized protein n=1 Tax=Portunus trituberculatus TaxID=210409 RepID=A0A5B7H369_PORTR|nr:hypothetical protein [Portunus trituberculatus]